jgi:hypothetical protein
MESRAVEMGGPDDVRAFPSEEGRRRLGVEETKWYELIRPGENGAPPEIVTFTIGRRRYVTESELRRFIQKKIEESLKESASARQEKVRAAVKERARRRAARRPAKPAARDHG